MNTKQALAGSVAWALALLFVMQGSATAEDAPEQDQSAENPAGPGMPQRCVHMRRIDHTRIIDDSNILFYMHGPAIFHNQLPHRCAGLKIAGTFMYRTSLTSLCNVDLITVLRQFGGGFSPGPSCGLGMFKPITAEEAKLLKTRTVEPDHDSEGAEIEQLE